MKTIATLCCLLLYFGLGGQVAVDFEAAKQALAAELHSGSRQKGAEQLTKCLKLSENNDSLRVLALEYALIYHATWGEKNAENTVSLRLLAQSAQTFGKKSSQYARALALRAKYLETSEQIEAGGLLLEQAMGIYEALGEQKLSDYCEIQHYLAQSYHEQARFEQAEQLYHSVLQRVKVLEGDSSLFYLDILVDLADLYREVGHYEKSVQLYTEARDGSQRFHPHNLVWVYGISNDFAIVYMALGRYAEAQELLLPANDFYAKYLERGNHKSLQIANNLAYTYFKLGNLDVSEKILRQNIGLSAQHLGKSTAIHLTLIFDLAVILQARTLHSSAYALLQANFEYLQAIYPPTHPIYVQWLNRMAELCLESDNLYLTQAYVRQAKSNNGGADKMEALASLWVEQNLLAKNYSRATSCRQKQQIAKQANDVFGSAAQIFEAYRQSLFSDSDKFVALKHSEKWAIAAIDWAMKTELKTSMNTAFGWVEENKACVLSDKIRAARADNSAFMGSGSDYIICADLANLNKKLQQLRRDFDSSSGQEQKQILTKNINATELRIRQLSQKIAPKNTKNKQNIGFSQADISLVQARLSGAELLLAYFVSDEKSFVFAIERDAVRLYVLPLKKADLRDLVANFYAQISDSEQIYAEPDAARRAFVQTAHDLYKQILAPALPADGKKNHLIIIADDALLQIPFAPLLTDSAQLDYPDLPYLLRQYAIEYHYSAPLWAQGSPANLSVSPPLQILGIAAKYEKNWAILPAAEREIQALQAVYKGDYCQNMPEKKAFFAQNAHKYGVLHLAMHGYIDRQTPSRSALIFSDSQRIEAWEIANLQLHNQLVVLSACQSGAGKYQQGEGVMSLARVFLQSGAQALVVSLWQINDQIASDFMPNFYAQLACGHNKAEALRQTQLQHLRTYKGKIAAPSYWAAFVHIGAATPINLARVGNKYGILATILAVFGTTGTWFYFRRKGQTMR